MSDQSINFVFQVLINPTKLLVDYVRNQCWKMSWNQPNNLTPFEVLAPWNLLGTDENREHGQLPLFEVICDDASSEGGFQHEKRM